MIRAKEIGRSALEPAVAEPRNFLDRWGSAMSPSQRQLVLASMAQDPLLLRVAPRS